MGHPPVHRKEQKQWPKQSTERWRRALQARKDGHGPREDCDERAGYREEGSYEVDAISSCPPTAARSGGSRNDEFASRRAFGMAPAAKDPEAIVREFCATCEERNVDKVLTYFTDDAL